MPEVSPAAPRLGTVLEEARAAEREGDLDGALRHYEQALRELASSGSDAGAAADILRWIGTVRRMREELELAAEAYEASLTIAEADEDVGRRAAALNCLGILDQVGGALNSAEQRYAEARVLAVSAADDSLIAMLDQNLATLANIRGDVLQALESYQNALRRLLALDRQESAATVLNNMGMAYVDLQEWERADEHFDRAYHYADSLRDSALLALIDLNRSELQLRQGRLREARETCDRAFEAYSRIGSDAGRGEAQKLYGLIALESGRPFVAESYFDNALRLAESSADRLLEAEVEAERGRMYLEQERNREALQALNRAHRLFTDLDARRELHDLDRRLDGLEKTYMDVVRRWGASIEAKDQYTAGHCDRVAEVSCALAAEVGFSGRQLAWFRMGGFLHDVGKTAVPADVLNKPGPLSDEEWVLMKTHPVVGHEIVEELKFPGNVSEMVRSHHERWDGGGYPDGLAGEEIPVTARILCLADVYDALTTTRSYRRAMSHEEAMDIMERDNGKAFDPDLFPRFRALIEDRRGSHNGASSTVNLPKRSPARATLREA